MVLTDLVLRCGLASMKIDSAHRGPDVEHSCRALAIIAFAISFIPALSSTLIASSHNISFLGFFNLAFSKTDRALINNPRFSSSFAKRSHSEIELTHFLICNHKKQFFSVILEQIIVSPLRCMRQKLWRTPSLARKSVQSSSTILENLETLSELLLTTSVPLSDRSTTIPVLHFSS